QHLGWLESALCAQRPSLVFILLRFNAPSFSPVFAGARDACAWARRNASQSSMSAPSATAAFTFADRRAVVIDRALSFLTHRNRNGEADFCNAKIERYLAMPELLQQLGLGERAKKKSLCPFHHDQHASFSVWQRNGSWFWKCHAGCGAGDEINFLEKYKDISRGQAIALYHEMAGVRSSSPTPQRKSSNGSKPIDWQQCVNALKPAELVRLGNERWYSRAFCSWLHSRKLIGLHGGDFAFPVGRNEAVVGVHYRVEDGSWRYHPQGTKTALFIVGNLATAKHVHASESQ